MDGVYDEECRLDCMCGVHCDGQVLGGEGEACLWVMRDLGV